MDLLSEKFDKLLDLISRTTSNSTHIRPNTKELLNQMNEWLINKEDMNHILEKIKIPILLKREENEFLLEFFQFKKFKL